MFVDGFTRFDVDQGELGKCWISQVAHRQFSNRRVGMTDGPTDGCQAEREPRQVYNVIILSQTSTAKVYSNSRNRSIHPMFQGTNPG